MTEPTALTIYDTHGGSYDAYFKELHQRRKELSGIKHRIDHNTGNLSTLLACFGRAAPLRELVEREVQIVGEMSSILDELTTQYGQERETLLTYLDTLATRLDLYRDQNPLAPPSVAQAREKNHIDAERLRGMRRTLDDELTQTFVHQRQAQASKTVAYGEEAVQLARLSQEAYSTFKGVASAVRAEHEHLQATSNAYVSLIELGRTGQVLRSMLGKLRACNGKLYLTVDHGVEQVGSLFRANRVPVIAPRYVRLLSDKQQRP